LKYDILPGTTWNWSYQAGLRLSLLPRKSVFSIDFASMAYPEDENQQFIFLYRADDPEILDPIPPESRKVLS
jgi:hypothetical protein